MKKKILIFHILYYILSLLIYIGFLYSAPWLLRLSEKGDLGTVMTFAYGMLFVATPVIVAVLMRFSLFKWYVDPIAAAEVPLFLYFDMVITAMNRADDLKAAFLLVNKQLSDYGGEGWLFFIGLFVFGLIASFSIARKRGESISYRLISKCFNKNKQ